MVIAGSLPFLLILRHYTLPHGELQISNSTYILPAGIYRLTPFHTTVAVNWSLLHY